MAAVHCDSEIVSDGALFLYKIAAEGCDELAAVGVARGCEMTPLRVGGLVRTRVALSVGSKGPGVGDFEVAWVENDVISSFSSF